MESRKSRMHDVIAQQFLQDKNKNKFGHAVAATLRGKQGLVEHYELYRFSTQGNRFKASQQQQQAPMTTKNDTTIAAAVIKVGKLLDGPIGITHGGIIALLYDDVMSFSCQPFLPFAVTRDLAVEYKRPQPNEEFVIIRVYIDNIRTEEYNNDANNRPHHQHQQQQQQQASKNHPTPQEPKNKRVFLRATCNRLGAAAAQKISDISNLQLALADPQKDGTLYSTATITMVQVKNRPPSARGDSQIPNSIATDSNNGVNTTTIISGLKSRL